MEAVVTNKVANLANELTFTKRKLITKIPDRTPTKIIIENVLPRLLKEFLAFSFKFFVPVPSFSEVDIVVVNVYVAILMFVIDIRHNKFEVRNN